MLLQPNLESVLIKINNFINIDANRQIYADHFAYLKNTIFKQLRTNKVFFYMFNGFQLEGSYGDNVKVSVPNEFDMVFHIKFPEQSLIDVSKDEEVPGNVVLNFTKVIRKIANEKQHIDNLRHLKQWLDEKHFLKIEKFQLFIQSCFVNALAAMQNQITFNGKKASLRYKREGPAHTIYVCESLNFQYSVDFVPGILLNDTQCVIPNLKGHWEAIPKPSKINHHSNISFRTSYYRQEHDIIKDKKQLKNVFRMLKKFRDTKTNMNKMKSYFIKTLFLYKARQENSNYWTKSLTDIIIDMFKELERSLQEQNLPFFWNQNLNLYQHYSTRLLHEMLNCVKSSREALENAAALLTIARQKRVYRIFLTTHELDSLDEEIQICLNPKVEINTLPIIQTKNDEEEAQVEASNKFQCILS